MGDYEASQGNYCDPLIPTDYGFWHKIADERAAEIVRLNASVNHLNMLLRESGWGQGEIDSAAEVVERFEAATASLERLNEQFKAFIRTVVADKCAPSGED